MSYTAEQTRLRAAGNRTRARKTITYHLVWGASQWAEVHAGGAHDPCARCGRGKRTRQGSGLSREELADRAQRRKDALSRWLVQEGIGKRRAAARMGVTARALTRWERRVRQRIERDLGLPDGDLS